MDGPWYEQSGPTKDEVIKDMKRVFYINYSRNKKIISLTILSQIIIEEVDKEYSKYNGFGSYRGYATFSRRDILENIEDRIVEIIPQISRKKICTFFNNSRKFSIWMNDILYRPPPQKEDDKPVGLRYGKVKTEFNSKLKKK